MKLFSTKFQPKGQALVETAIITPLLIFMLIGVFEVGWALRGYLLLISANREAARFAVRPGYLTYDEESYAKIVGQAFNTAAGQLDLQERGDFIITVIQVDTQLVCDPFARNDAGVLLCNCGITDEDKRLHPDTYDIPGAVNNAVTNPYSQTLVMSPLTHITHTYRYPITSTRRSLLDLPTLITESVVHNRKFNCNLMHRNAVPIADVAVYVEMWYEQPQLFGFPLISNPFTDPVPMYAHTAMRKIQTRE